MSYTYRQLFTKHLPEPYRSQAIANAIADDRNVDDPSSTCVIDPDSLEDLALCAFTWSCTPEGHAYWCAASQGRFEAPDPQAPGPTAKSRIADLESRVQILEAGLPGVVTGPPAIDPGEGYRLLEEGETILDGDEEADEEEGGGWSRVHFTGDVYKPRNWYPVRRCDPGEGYRLVKGYEFIETGDEWLERGEWNPTGIKTGGGVRKAVSTPLRRKIPGPPAPPTYRLLNPGEIIREGDEVWFAGQESWETFWPGVIGDLKANYPAPPARRQIKSYEDA